MAFCSVCRQIPDQFFTQVALRDRDLGVRVSLFPSLPTNAIQYLHHSWKGLEHSANLGCPLCKLLYSSAITDKKDFSAVVGQLSLRHFVYPGPEEDVIRFGLTSETIGPATSISELMSSSGVTSWACFFLIPLSWGRYQGLSGNMQASGG